VKDDTGMNDGSARMKGPQIQSNKTRLPYVSFALADAKANAKRKHFSMSVSDSELDFHHHDGGQHPKEA
jgi:hypothetical protein